MKISSCLFFLLVGFAGAAYAEVKLNSIFGDGMVLQRELPISVWGTANPGEQVMVQFAGQHLSGAADTAGKWLIILRPLPASAEPRELIVTTANSKIKISGVLVGEVWLCSGQSNMEWALGRCTGGPEAVTNSANPQLRLCTIPHNSAMTPQDEVATKWVVSGPGSTKFFSAIAWWFGSKLQKELGVPVGIINDSYGGTQIQDWMAAETLRKGPWPHDKSTDIALAKADHDQRKARFQPAMDKYLAEKAAAIKNKTPVPELPAGWPGDFRGPSVLWNGMVAPLLKLSLRGVLWYQGESNAYLGVGDTYASLLPAMIAGWRAGFAQPDLPFLIFQISAYRKPQTDPNEASGMAELREAQLKTALTMPHSALVVTMDLGETNVHYLNKEPAGERGLNAALGLAYGRQLEFTSPTYRSWEIKGDQALVHFAHAAGGLAAKGNPLSGFVIAGEDHKFVFADARIEGETVIVSSPQVSKPVAVRYGWADFPKVNLFSKARLPASPFRTDDWPNSNPKNPKK